MRNYWFGKHCSNWQVWVMMAAGFTLGSGHPWGWLFILVVGAAVDAIGGAE